jgi:hypothetical protein
VTVLYRATGVEHPDLVDVGRGSFWTRLRENTEFLAQLEAATPPPTRVYQVEVTIGDSVRTQPMDALLPLVRNKPMRDALPLLRDMLLKRAERAGRDWTQFTEQDRSWHDAMLYMGDEPLRASVASPEN